jgi:hypothetical protein
MKKDILVHPFLNKADPAEQNESRERKRYMRTSIYAVAVTAFTLTGCAVVSEPPPTVTTTTTEVRREVVTTGPGTQPVTREIVVAQAPPAVRFETRTVSPGPQYVYTRGYWRWGGMKYEWVPGSWIMRPRPAAVWVDGGWARRPGGWVWVRGHWE